MHHDSRQHTHTQIQFVGTLMTRAPCRYIAHKRRTPRQGKPALNTKDKGSAKCRTHGVAHEQAPGTDHAPDSSARSRRKKKRRSGLCLSKTSARPLPTRTPSCTPSTPVVSTNCVSVAFPLRQRLKRNPPRRKRCVLTNKTTCHYMPSPALTH